MIFYFSATGNSKHVAEGLLEEGEQLVPIAQALDKKQPSYRVSDERVGIVSPTYDWTLPSVVSEFLEGLTLQFDERPYLYYVATYGTTSGAAAAMANHIMGEKGLPFDACFDVKMPDTWTPIFDLSDPEQVQRTLEGSEREIGELKAQVRAKVTGRHMALITPYFTGEIGRALYNGITRNTSNLTVTDACVGCGLCARKCPVHAIKMENRRPVWVKKKCAMCLGCLHRCPKFAIQCGRSTSAHGQYVNPYTKI